MPTAFVLSGGGSLGAVQVGMLQALGARGVRPDLLVGTSAGAVNAAWVAQHGTSPESLARLAALWGGLRRSDVFPVASRRALLAVAGRARSLFPDTGLRRLLDDHVTMGRLEDARIPVHMVATDLLCGEEVLLSTGDPTAAVLASCAIPGVLPPVAHHGRLLVDGGVAHHAAVSQAVELGATEVYVLPAGYPCALTTPPRSALGVAVQALTLLIEQRLIDEVAGYDPSISVHVLPPLCPLSVSAADFGHAHELIDRSEHASRTWLAQGMHALPAQERFLSLHHHRSAPPPSDDRTSAA
ncbi:MAG TPA: patatin-like phospholipase family protein [Nocardioides sp.]|uniref:patatin-like phospholipase family protein n=1 Tax=Nocardioides sp. TaxID=35761 RepID=UPI002E344008|nr:patatin-like phospholipase family protein [Nocardioides sp.]HEX5087832.1 patatin-like phospholipase family protein [Nocardioides sp.]